MASPKPSGRRDLQFAVGAIILAARLRELLARLELADHSAHVWKDLARDAVALEHGLLHATTALEPLIAGDSS